MYKTCTRLHFGAGANFAANGCICNRILLQYICRSYVEQKEVFL